MKKPVQSIIALLIISVLAIIGLLTFQNRRKVTTLSIVTTNFPSYDFARAITKDIPNTSLKMLVSPGVETHDFEPTPQDIIDIKTSDFFIYTGGESDYWIENVLKDIDLAKTKVIKLLDLVEVKKEEIISGMENIHEHNHATNESEIDEHVWTSLKNSIQIIESVSEEFTAQNPTESKYLENATAYISELKTIDAEIEALIQNAKRKTLIFGDRFPLRYFVDDYGLDYFAAFPGCSEQTEASASTIAFLVDKVKSLGVPVIFRIELSGGLIADEIARSTGAQVLEFHTAHNISKNDFDSGKTYVDIMRDNLIVLKEALY